MYRLELSTILLNTRDLTAKHGELLFTEAAFKSRILRNSTDYFDGTGLKVLKALVTRALRQHLQKL